MIRFTVLGTPATAGSKRAFPFRRKDGSLGVNVTHDDAKTKSWRAIVVDAARSVYTGPPLDGPIRLTLTFIRPRPQGHYRTGKNAGQLKDAAPKHPIAKPDCTKLTRAVEDALKSIAWRDDSQIVEQSIKKVFGEPAGCVVEIEAIES